MEEQLPRQSSSIMSTRGQREVTMTPRPPWTRICTLPNHTHMFPYYGSIDTDSSATNIIETDYDNNQQPMEVVLI